MSCPSARTKLSLSRTKSKLSLTKYFFQGSYLLLKRMGNDFLAFFLGQNIFCPDSGTRQKTLAFQYIYIIEESISLPILMSMVGVQIYCATAWVRVLEMDNDNTLFEIKCLLDETSFSMKVLVAIIYTEVFSSAMHITVGWTRIW